MTGRASSARSAGECNLRDREAENILVNTGPRHPCRHSAPAASADPFSNSLGIYSPCRRSEEKFRAYPRASPRSVRIVWGCCRAETPVASLAELSRSRLTAGFSRPGLTTAPGQCSRSFLDPARFHRAGRQQKAGRDWCPIQPLPAPEIAAGPPRRSTALPIWPQRGLGLIQVVQPRCEPLR
jgi:hypothetical protein